MHIHPLARQARECDVAVAANDRGGEQDPSPHAIANEVQMGKSLDSVLSDL